MIGSWMVYSLLVALCLSIAANAAERTALLYGKPARGVWVLALLGSLVVPFINLGAGVRVDPIATGPDAIQMAPVVATSFFSSPLQDYLPMPVLSDGFDGVLIVLWLAFSLALGALAVVSLWRLDRERRGWRRGKVDGRPVLVSDHAGPAVVGLLNHEVVVPGWLLGLDPALRRVALQHEDEHLRAGDLKLLTLASLAVLLFPWNFALWWQLRRLRSALEADCDARVLRRGTDVRTYGNLLLEVGARAWYPRIATMALMERRSSLARRIEIMTFRPRARLLQACGAVVLAGSFTLLACETPVPSQMNDDESQLALAADVYGESAVDEPPQRISSPPLEYPRTMQQAGIEGHVMLQAIVDVAGNIEPGSVEILESSHSEFEEAGRLLLVGSKFKPGMAKGEAVRTLIQLPIQFTLFGGPKDETPDPPEGGVGVAGVEPFVSVELRIHTAPAAGSERSG